MKTSVCAFLALILACCAVVMAARRAAEIEDLRDCRAAVTVAGLDERALMAIARLEQETDVLRVRVEELEDAVAKEK